MVECIVQLAGVDLFVDEHLVYTHRRSRWASVGRPLSNGHGPEKVLILRIEQDLFILRY